MAKGDSQGLKARAVSGQRRSTSRHATCQWASDLWGAPVWARFLQGHRGIVAQFLGTQRRAWGGRRVEAHQWTHPAMIDGWPSCRLRHLRLLPLLL
jgi:hypothetical protein